MPKHLGIMIGLGRFAHEEPDEDDEHESPQHDPRNGGEKYTKSEANYRRAECCGVCRMFEPNGKHETFGECTLVKGIIGADMLCDYFKKDGPGHHQDDEGERKQNE